MRFRRVPVQIANEVPEGSGADSWWGSGEFRCRLLMRFRRVPGQIAKNLPRSSKLLGITYEFIFFGLVSLFGVAISWHFLIRSGSSTSYGNRSTNARPKGLFFVLFEVKNKTSQIGFQKHDNTLYNHVCVPRFCGTFFKKYPKQFQQKTSMTPVVIGHDF